MKQIVEQLGKVGLCGARWCQQLRCGAGLRTASGTRMAPPVIHAWIALAAAAGAELLATACCIGSEALAQRQARALCSQLAASLKDSGSPEAR